MSKNKDQIIIKKIKKGKAGGHHGGMWKVAYADFITAMMVLFLMLWIINNTPKSTLNALGNYFEPTIFKEKNTKPNEVDSNKLDNMDVASEKKTLMFNKLNSSIEGAKEKNIKLRKDKNGVSIIIESSENKLIFENGKSDLSSYAKQKLEYLSKIISKLPYYITISSHTNGIEIPLNESYNNWDLSLDRVNNIRKFFVQTGLSDDRLISISANSNSMPQDSENLTVLKNRRIEILMLTDDDFISPSKKNLPNSITQQENF